MGVDGAVAARLAAKFAEFRPHVDERGWRLYLGSEARAHADAEGCPLAAAVAVVAAAAGVSRAMVTAGAGELAEGAEAMPGRSRRPGAGRPAAGDAQPGLRQALLGLAEAATRGDPMAEVTWCSLSLRDLARELAGRGFRCGKDAVARILREEGYSLQAMAKVLEGSQHPDRDAQFRHVNGQVAAYRAAGDPVISVDAKKKELIGPYHRDGRSWRPGGDPVRVLDHDFMDRELGRIAPYGIYDIAANRGFVLVGSSHDTAAFAVAAIRAWWQRAGSLRYPAARRLLIACDAGGSNGYRCHLWKDQLAVLAAETGLEVTVCHFPPGTSKWNKIEHRLFCHVTRTWRARPLMTAEDAVAGIAATVTAQGLKCTAVLDDGHYPDKVKVSGERVQHLEDRVISRDPFHGEWNYAIAPAPRPAPEPEAPPAGPDPAMVQALASLAGIPGLAALPDAIAVHWQAGREQRLHLDRGSARRRGTGPKGQLLIPLDAVIAATAAHHVAGISYTLLARLLGAGTSSISQVARQATPALAILGITPRPGHAPIRTIAQLTEHAATLGITIPLPEHTQSNHDPPETADLLADSPNRGITDGTRRELGAHRPGMNTTKRAKVLPRLYLQLARTVAASAIRWSLVHGGPSAARGPSSTTPARSPRILAARASTSPALKRWTRQPRACAHSASTWQYMTESARASCGGRRSTAMSSGKSSGHARSETEATGPGSAAASWSSDDDDARSADARTLATIVAAAASPSALASCSTGAAGIPGSIRSIRRRSTTTWPADAVTATAQPR
jgi:hypothetical protein